jgi:hypothetical protein
MRLMTRAGGPPRGRATLQASTRETSVSTAPPEIDDIRRKMAQIRRDLHADVQNVVQGAEAATDWRRFIRNYPWASMGVALAVGYTIVPRRHKAATIQVAPAEIARAVALEAPRPPEPEKKKGKGLLGTAFGLLAPVAFRAVQGYALQFAEQWLAQRVAQQMQLHPDLAAAFGAQEQPSQQGLPGSQGPRGPQVGPRGAPRF